MSIWHESISRLLNGSTLEGELVSGNGLDMPIRMNVRRLEHGPGTHDWVWDAEIERDGECHAARIQTAIRWAGSTPVVAIPQRSVHGLGDVSGRFLIHNGQFAGTLLINDRKVACFGRVLEDEDNAADADRPRYVIERSSEFLREWWTGTKWTEDAGAARWYRHEPDAPGETEDEGSHAVFYRSGTVEPG